MKLGEFIDTFVEKKNTIIRLWFKTPKTYLPVIKGHTPLEIETAKKSKYSKHGVVEVGNISVGVKANPNVLNIVIEKNSLS